MCAAIGACDRTKRNEDNAPDNAPDDANSATVTAVVADTTDAAKPNAPKPNGPKERVALRKIAAELAAIGVIFDASQIKTKVIGVAEAKPFLDKQQDLLFGPNHFTVFRTVAIALGLAPGASAADLRRQSVAALAGTFVGLYDWRSDSMLFLDTEMAKLADKETLLGHELTHAFQDQHWDLGVFAQHKTVEQLKVLQCIIEGHAELASMKMLLKRSGKDLSGLDLTRSENTLGKLRIQGAAQAHYVLGFWHLLRRMRAKTFKLGTKRWPSMPPSTEQIIHPEKYGTDTPTDVTLPKWPTDAGPATLLEHNTYGELMLFVLLLQTSLDGGQAYVAATGWDGDRLGVYKTPKGEALMWRIVLDRERDAKQVEKILGRGIPLTLRRRGRVIDITYASDAALEARLTQALATFPADFVRNPQDALTTAAAEKSWAEALQKKPSIRGNRWVHPSSGVSVPVLAGWSLLNYQGQKVLGKQQLGKLTHTVMVMEVPNPNNNTLEQTMVASRQLVGRLNNVKLVSMTKGVKNGIPVVNIRVAGRAPGAIVASVSTTTSFRRGKYWVHIVVSVEESLWQQAKTEVETLLAGIKLKKLN